jgi:hypothetical protein
MATKAELRDSYIAAGWAVQPVANWLPVSLVDGRQKYDVQVASPDDEFATAQVVVDDDGGPSEDARAAGIQWDRLSVGFPEALRSYIESIEGAQVFAVSVDQVFEQEEVATVTAYMDDGSQAKYAVKRRNGTFSQKALI